MAPIFKKDRILGIRAFLLVMLAGLLMFADVRGLLVQRIRFVLSYVVSPIPYVVNFPVDAVNSIMQTMSSQHALREENLELHAELTLLQSKLQQQYAIVDENRQLRALLQSSIRVQDTVTEAQLMAVMMNPFMRHIVINKGARDKVMVGQPVLDAYGVMGQVVSVQPSMSEVMLLTDSRSAIPVQNNRNGMRAIAVGDPDSSMLKLRDMTVTNDVQEGDLFISSGLGGRYPFGYPVGKVVSVQNVPGKQFLQVLVRPMAHMNRSRLVLLVEEKTA